MFGLMNRDRHQASTLDEFENLIARLSSFLLTEHNEDGTHLVEPQGTDFVPTGALMDWTTTVAPANWVLCDGRQINRVDYKRLFDVIGITYGAGDGALTFNVPDIRGRVKMGLAAAGTGSTLGGVGGALDHTHTGPSHTHTGPSHTHTGGAVSGSTAAEAAHTHAAGSLAGPNHAHTIDGIAAGGSHTHNGTTNGPTGITVTTIGGAGGVATSSHDHGFTTDSGGSHSHTQSTTTSNAGTGAVTGSTAAGSSHSHAAGTLAVGTSGAEGTGATSAAGTGATGTANQAFIAFPVIIKD